MVRTLFLIGLAGGFAVSAWGDGLPSGPPQEAGMKADFIPQADALVAKAIAEKKMPGCVVCVGRRGKLVFLKAYGDKRLLPQREPMTADTVFDLASLTKPIATATSVMLLVEAGKLKLEDKVAARLPEFSGPDRAEIDLVDLLTHRSGLPASHPHSDYQQPREELWRRIAHVKLLAPRGEKFTYSDVNYLLLGRLIEQSSGMSADQFTQERIFQPLGMRETGYLPSAELRLRAAPTQEREGRWMVGEVHDPKAYFLGGVAGHAGLFSNASDLAIYAQMLLNRGSYGGRQILQPETVARMTKRYPVPAPPSSSEDQAPKGGPPAAYFRGLGWDMQTGYSTNKPKGMSELAFGHGGFTGTALWIDPAKELFVIFLSNRVHPDGKGLVNPLIGELGGLVVASLKD
jgi:CubicO group peptidase (beta-lactamase class C family)